MYFLFIVLALVILGLLIYLATLDGCYSVKQKQMLNADISTVFDKVADFKSWPDWSPWLIHEAGTKLQFSENFNQEKGFYTWDGELVGAGKLTHLTFDRPYKIDQRLEFTRPFKSLCKVGFELSEKNGQTELSWLMEGKMPFLFRFMSAKTESIINKDFALGLAMLNGQIDTLAEHPQIQFLGEVTREPVCSLCEAFSGDVVEMGEAMQQGFPKLINYVEQHQGDITGAPFTAYHESDPETQQFVCDMAIPIAQKIEPGPYSLKTLVGGRYYKVALKGDYQFLELAWYAAASHIHMLKLKYDVNKDSFEVYENDPEQVETSNDVLTTLYLAIK